MRTSSLPSNQISPETSRRRALVQAEDGLARHRLARARLADDAEDLATIEVERQAVDRLDQTVPGGEVHAQIAHGQERRRRLGLEVHVDGRLRLHNQFSSSVGRQAQAHARVDERVEDVDDQVGDDEGEGGDHA